MDTATRSWTSASSKHKYKYKFRDITWLMLQCCVGLDNDACTMPQKVVRRDQTCECYRCDEPRGICISLFTVMLGSLRACASLLGIRSARRVQDKSTERTNILKTGNLSPCIITVYIYIHIHPARSHH